MFQNIKVLNIDFCQENFIVFFLNSQNQVVEAENVFKGGINKCIIDQRTVYRKALLHNANSIIVAHNHPSGHLQPSPEDEEVNSILKQAGEIVGCKLLDFIVFNKTQYYSMDK